jgi:hypothetical protein
MAITLIRGVTRALPVTLALLGTDAFADDRAPLGSARALSADPNAPTFALVWRGSLRGTMSSRLPIAGHVDLAGFHLALLPLVELHNEIGDHDPLPNDDWRGRLSLEAGYTVTPAQTGFGWASVTFAVQHESDHRSARVDTGPGFLEHNDVALRGSLAVPLGGASIVTTWEGGLLAGSCTTFSPPCRDLRGATSLSEMVEVLATTRRIGPISPFLSVVGMFVVPTGALSRERRLVAQGGLASRTQSRGLWQGGLVAFLGNDIGYTRTQTVHQVGLFLRWSP